MSGTFTAALTELEARVQDALRTRDSSHLEILGCGDSTLVLACDTPSGRFACKRLPPFASLAELRAYCRQIERYGEALQERGVPVLETRVETIPLSGDRWTAYCVQPLLEPHSLLEQFLRHCSEEEAHARLEQLLDAIVSTVDARVGLDADVSNWAYVNGRLVFIDVTTPMLRDEKLQSEADYGAFLPSLPAFVRWFITTDRAASMLEKFYSPRAVIVDVLCGLIRRRIGRVPYLMARANRRLERPITPFELRRYFAVNESTWAAFRRLQRLERWWSVSVRGRSYPFLLPPASAFAGHFAAAPLFSPRLE